MVRFLAKNKRLLTLFALFLIALTLYAQDVEQKTSYNTLDRLVLSLFLPPLRFSTYCISSVVRVWNNYLFLVDLKNENLFLREYIEKLEIENQLLKDHSVENKRLRELLSFKEKLSYHILPAEIIGRDPSSWFNTILIDKGETDGVIRGAGVISPEGVVGQVTSVAGDSSQVLLITDAKSSVDVILNRSGANGILEGLGQNRCLLNYVSKTEDIKKDDIIVSTGLNEVFPKGIVVGSISDMRRNIPGFFLHIDVKPAVDFSKLREVLVVMKPQTKKAHD